MKKHLLLAGLAALSMTSARAGVVTDYDTVLFDFIFKWGASYGPSAGKMTIHLNDNGTMSAQFDAPDSLKWLLITLDSGTKNVNYFANISNFSNSTGKLYPYGGYVTPLAAMATGLLCSPYCTGSASWTFGKAGQFSTTDILINGGHTYWSNIGPVPAYLRTTTNAYYSGWNYPQVQQPDPPSPSKVPEPATISLAGAGLMAIAVSRRRFRRRA